MQNTQNAQFDSYSNLENKSKKEPGTELAFFEDGVKFNREYGFYSFRRIPKLPVSIENPGKTLENPLNYLWKFVFKLRFEPGSTLTLEEG